VNISQDSLALSTTVPLCSDTPLPVQFKLPQLASAIAADVAVRWYRDGNAGLLFLSLDPSLRSEPEWLS